MTIPYWTRIRGPPTLTDIRCSVQVVVMSRLSSPNAQWLGWRGMAQAAVLVTAVLGSASVARAEVVGAHVAQAAVSRGAIVWDLRERTDYLAGHLPGAVQARTDWLGDGSAEPALDALQQAVSDAGIDLSREVIVYGQPGDARVMALYRTLERVAAGKVHWLVGGVAEWQQAGAALSQDESLRRPVPQRLTVLRDDGQAGPMAGDALRRSHVWSPRAVARLEASAH